ANVDAGNEQLQTPLRPCEDIGLVRPSQRLNSPTTLTRAAFGAQQAKRTPRTPSRCSTWLPSMRYACSSRPSLNRYKSSAPMTGANVYGSNVSNSRADSFTFKVTG